ncbi:MAG TPA: hypothetical protein VK730_13525 [Solirubrobacteraceae bacterium]|jgi:hypothetical protein|nr:hypothetical protein [Solirubrobacteraceae bacterium]
MGLLDDAIREHLELKRLQGADPGVVAREEHDALGPVPRRGESAYEDEVDDGSGLATTHDDEAPPAPDVAPTADSVDSGSIGQETVEINMEAELASEGDFDPSPTADRDTRVRPVAHPASTRAISDESLEWEVPADETEKPALADDEQGSDVSETSDQAEPVEDVLEETPDFLRETPEQERLWFEQRPPRDFDFNE